MAYNRFGFGNLVGRNVKINRGGPDSIEGLLLDAQSDYLIAVADGGFVYVKDEHVKSITDTGKSGGARESIVNPITAYNFVGVMQALRYRFVKVNRGGPEKLEGIIVDVNQNYLILTVKGQEVVHIPVSHIKSITVVRGGGNRSGGSQNQNSSSQGNNAQGNNSQGNNTQSNQSGGNRTGGNQSGGNRTGGSQSGGNRTAGNQTRGNRTAGNQTAGDWMNWTGGNQSKNRSGKRNRSGNRSNHRSGNRNRSGKRRSGGE
ncbi:hypothetical protein V4V36_12940 [Paenibacillus lautus]|uniref:hypothetical protein n=1 Tax=Paenibacillus lautus TaxID=1401 RepID=UPI0026EDF3E1|nr:hypothetical protein [Paenibacillus lautus]MBY0159832.1 hypothetical protein [Cytobacillus firmus]MCI1778200.1 hypothetical protein [Paenibacillus lautus]